MAKRRRRNPMSEATKARLRKLRALAWKGTKAGARIAGKTAYHTGRIAGKSALAAGRVAALETRGLICRPRSKNPITYRVQFQYPSIVGTSQWITMATYAVKKHAIKGAKDWSRAHPRDRVRIVKT